MKDESSLPPVRGTDLHSGDSTVSVRGKEMLKSGSKFGPPTYTESDASGENPFKSDHYQTSSWRMDGRNLPRDIKKSLQRKEALM